MARDLVVSVQWMAPVVVSGRKLEISLCMGQGLSMGRNVASWEAHLGTAQYFTQHSPIQTLVVPAFLQERHPRGILGATQYANTGQQNANS